MPSDELINEYEITDARLVSLKTLAELMDADRSTVRRWLSEAGIQAVVAGRGRRGAVRYRWAQVKAWLDSLESIG
jgi:phage terminase Nu1 subunit (DNA packaging protein)